MLLTQNNFTNQRKYGIMALNQTFIQQICNKLVFLLEDEYSINLTLEEDDELFEFIEKVIEKSRKNISNR